MTVNPVVIVDLDGTLCNIDHRVHYILSNNEKSRDWDSFYAGCINDSPNQIIIDWVNRLHREGYRIYIISGRRASTYRDTKKWLHRYRVSYDRLFLPRKDDDKRPDALVKKDIFGLLPPSTTVLFVIDDRPSVIKMWRSMGLTVYPVHQNRWEGRE